MSSVNVRAEEGVAILTLARGKVNAVDGSTAACLHEHVRRLEHDPDVRAIVVAGQGSFFSFGFDVPALYALSPGDFTEFLFTFTDLYLSLFACSKPVVAAINGHAIAGGCMLATSADHRVMATGKARISLNESTFGAALFAGSVEMLTHLVGERQAETVALGGAMYSAEEARAIGLVDEAVPPEAVVAKAVDLAAEMGSRDGAAYAAIKALLRNPIRDRIRLSETASIRRFVEIWYSPSTREQLKRIQIRG